MSVDLIENLRKTADFTGSAGKHSKTDLSGDRGHRGRGWQKYCTEYG